MVRGDAVRGALDVIGQNRARTRQIGSEEIGAWCQTYAFGRTFNNGRSQEHSPELQLTSLNGLFASAFTATLYQVRPLPRMEPAHLAQYVSEVKPLLVALGTGLFARIEGFLCAPESARAYSY